MTKQAEQVSDLIANRKLIPAKDLAKEVVRMFSMALEEKDAAKEMLGIPNRLVENLCSCVTNRDERLSTATIS